MSEPEAPNPSVAGGPQQGGPVSYERRGEAALVSIERP